MMRRQLLVDVVALLLVLVVIALIAKLLSSCPG